MSAKITVGKIEGGESLQLDVARLIVSRLLIFASSGGGKSWLLRVMLEALSGVMQTIVIDSESEFASLRELRDMVLVGPGGEVPADPRSASLLCRRLMEMNLSAVIDVGELSMSDRREFVTNFTDTMVDLPRSLWRRCVVAIDEIQDYAPEGTKVESAGAISRLANKGRKRGYCLLGATQRLKMLDKDTAAALKNMFIGQATLDIDLQRAAGMLGFGKERWTEIRDLSPPGREGEFFAFGPALNVRGVVKFRAGKVKTTHPEPGQSKPAEPPAPSKKILSVLDELQDLPQAAEAEIKDLAAAKVENARLKRELDVVSRQASAAAPSRANDAIVARYRAELESAMKLLQKIADSPASTAPQVDAEAVRRVVDEAAARIAQLYERASSTNAREAEHLRREVAGAVDRLSRFINGHAHAAPAAAAAGGGEAPLPPPPSGGAERPRRITRVHNTDDPGGPRIKSGARRMLQILGGFSPSGLTGRQLGTLSGFREGGNTYKEYVGSLASAGFIDRAAGEIKVTASGIAWLAGDVLPPPTKAEIIAMFKQRLKSGAGRMLDWIVGENGRSFTREQIGRETGFPSDGNTFKEYFGALKTNNLVESADAEHDTWRAGQAFELAGESACAAIADEERVVPA